MPINDLYSLESFIPGHAQTVRQSHGDKVMQSRGHSPMGHSHSTSFKVPGTTSTCSTSLPYKTYKTGCDGAASSARTGQRWSERRVRGAVVPARSALATVGSSAAHGGAVGVVTGWLCAPPAVDFLGELN